MLKQLAESNVAMNNANIDALEQLLGLIKKD
jgi:hypothetical protein